MDAKRIMLQADKARTDYDKWKESGTKEDLKKAVKSARLLCVMLGPNKPTSITGKMLAQAKYVTSRDLIITTEE